MALNTRQHNFLSRLQHACSLGVQLAQVAPEIKQQFDEEFATGQDNALSDNEADLEALGLSSSDITSAVNQFIDNGYTNMWDGSAVSTREYGKDCRRVASQY
jgi:hypothetical protein